MIKITPRYRFRHRSNTARIIERLHRRTYDLATRDARRAVRVSRLSVYLIRAVMKRSPHAAGRFVFLTAESFRLMADAFARCRRFDAAERAAVAAGRLFADRAARPYVTDHEPRLHMTLSWILFCAGRTAESFELVGRAGETLLRERGDVLGWVKARTTAAAMRINLHQYRQALDILEKAMAAAQHVADREVLGAIAYNTALCAVELGDERAERCHAAAVRLFEEERMEDELIRARSLRGKVLRKKGRMAEAIAAFEAVAEEYESRQMPEVAAGVRINVLEILIETGATAEALRVGRQVLGRLDQGRYEQEAKPIRDYIAQFGRAES